jgi:transcriptional regulator with XRE-family HTH domain
VTKRLDPARDDAGARLRTARLRRGLTQTTLAGLACVSPAYVSMVETGQRELTRVRDIVALADVLQVSPLYLADGRDDTPPAGQRRNPAVPFPARTDPVTLARHQRLARQFVQLSHQDRRGPAAPPGPRARRESLAAPRPAHRSDLGEFQLMQSGEPGEFPRNAQGGRHSDAHANLFLHMLEGATWITWS